MVSLYIYWDVLVLCSKSSPYSQYYFKHIWHISLNTYGCHIPNISYTAIILNGHIHPTFLYTYFKAQPTAIHTSQAIVRYTAEQIHPPHWAYMLYTPHISWLKWKMYTHICATYKITGTDHKTRGKVNIFDISLNKYG